MADEEFVPVSLSHGSIIATRFHEDLDLAEEIQELPEFNQGTNQNPGKGYSVIEADDPDLSKRVFGAARSLYNMRRRRDLSDGADRIDVDLAKDYVEKHEDSVCHFFYEYETYEETEADVNGERKQVHIPNVNRAVGHWGNDGPLFLQGRPGAVENLQDDISDRLDSSITFDEVEFDADFLLWLVYKSITDGKIKGSVEMSNIFSAQMTDDSGSTGQVRMEATGENVLDQLLRFVLSGGSISSVSATLGNENGKFDIVISSKGELSVGGTWPKSITEEAISFYLPLSIEIVEIYSHWNNLSRNEQYPPPSFFINSYQDLDDDGEIELEINIDEVIEEYTIKRTGSMNDIEEIETDASTDESMANPRREEIFNDTTIGDALEIVESEIIEAKSSIPENIDQIAKEVAALANTRGGVLILGMADDGELVGLEDAREIEERVAGVITQSIEPPVDVNLMRRSVAEADLLIISVNKVNQTPRSVNGQYYKRVGTTIQELGPEELTQMIRES
jgi:hypothetical protein